MNNERILFINKNIKIKRIYYIDRLGGTLDNIGAFCRHILNNIKLNNPYYVKNTVHEVFTVDAGDFNDILWK